MAGTAYGPAVLIESIQVTNVGVGRAKQYATSATGRGVRGHGVPRTPLAPVVAALALHDGDVLLTINDQPLLTFERAVELAEQAVRDPLLTVTVFREAEGQIFTYFLGGLAPAARAPLERQATPFTGPLVVFGVVAGRAPRTMDLQLRGADTSAAVRVEIRPHIDTVGTFKGLEISDTEPMQEAERIGLRRGDIITTINGTRLVGLFQTLRTVQRAMKEPLVEVELSRDLLTVTRTLEPRL